MARLLPLSLLLPVKNAEQFLAHAIVQIEANLIVFDEVIVIDDGSGDSTLMLASAWAHRNSQVILVSNPGTGLVDSLNFGVSIAKHAWIARFDVDDLYHPDRLELQVQLISEGIVAIFSDYEFIDPAGRHIGYIPSGITPLATRFSLLSATRTPHPAVIFDKNVFHFAGGYVKDDYPAEDLGLWLRMSKLGKLASLGDAVLSYRLHPKSVTTQNRALSKQKKNFLLQKYQVNSIELENLYLEIPSITKLYHLGPYSDLRIILLIRELALAIRLIHGSKMKIIKSIFKLSRALSWFWPFSLAKFFYMWAIRKILRRKSNFPET